MIPYGGDEPVRRRTLEVLVALLLGLATAGSAWCAYQASQWNERSVEESRTSALARVEATRSYGLAAQTVAYDTTVVIAYAEAVVDDQDDLATLYRETLVRSGFLPILDRWKAQIANGESPTNLLDDQEYLDGLFADHRDADARADRHEALSAEAGRNGIDYVVTTLVLAVALFFAGVTHVFRGVGIRTSAVLCSGLLVAFALSRVAELPVI